MYHIILKLRQDDSFVLLLTIDKLDVYEGRWAIVIAFCMAAYARGAGSEHEQRAPCPTEKDSILMQLTKKQDELQRPL